MDKVTKLKEIIISLKMELIEERIPKGHCPYTFYTVAGKDINCILDCEKCRRIFMRNAEKKIREKIEEF